MTPSQVFADADLPSAARRSASPILRKPLTARPRAPQTMLAAPLSLAQARHLRRRASSPRRAQPHRGQRLPRWRPARLHPERRPRLLDGTPYDYDTVRVRVAHDPQVLGGGVLRAGPAVRHVGRVRRPPAPPPPPPPPPPDASRSHPAAPSCAPCAGTAARVGEHGTHSYNDGKCDLSPPDQCACYDDDKTKSDGNDAAKSAITAAAAAAAAAPKLLCRKRWWRGRRGGRCRRLSDRRVVAAGGRVPVHGADGGQRRHGLLQRLVRIAAAAAAAAQIRYGPQILSAARNSLPAKFADAPPTPPSSATAGRTTTRRTSRRARGSSASGSTACARRRRATSRTRSARRARRRGGSNPRGLPSATLCSVSHHVPPRPVLLARLVSAALRSFNRLLQDRGRAGRRLQDRDQAVQVRRRACAPARGAPAADEDLAGQREVAVKIPQRRGPYFLRTRRGEMALHSWRCAA